MQSDATQLASQLMDSTTVAAAASAFMPSHPPRSVEAPHEFAWRNGPHTSLYSWLLCALLLPF